MSWQSWLIVALCVIASIALVVTRFNLKMPALPERKEPEASERGSEGAHAHPPVAEKKEERTKKSGSQRPWQKPVAFGFWALVIFFAAYMFWPALNRMRDSFAEPREIAATQPVPQDAEGAPITSVPSVVCEDQSTVVHTLQPGDSVFVPTINGMTLDFLPYTSEGTLRACDWDDPSRCTDDGRGFTAPVNGMRLTNISAEPVRLRCWYYRNQP